MAETDNNLQSVATSYDDVNNALKQLTGQVESNSNLVTQAQLSGYLPLTGGTVTGDFTSQGSTKESFVSVHNSGVALGMGQRLLAMQGDENLVYYYRDSSGNVSTDTSLMGVGAVDSKGNHYGKFLNLSANKDSGVLVNLYTGSSIPSIPNVDNTRPIIMQIFAVDVNTSQSPCQIFFPKAFADTGVLHIQLTPISKTGAGSGGTTSGFYLSGIGSDNHAATASSFWVDTGFASQYNGFFVTAIGYAA